MTLARWPWQPNRAHLTRLLVHTPHQQNLRVLHHVRDQRIGMPLTIAQYRRMSLEVLIDRLVNRGVYWLAHEICRFMKLESTRAVNRVLVHWASTVVGLIFFPDFFLF